MKPTQTLLFTILLSTLLSAACGLAQNPEGEFMRVADHQVLVYDKLGYLVKKGYSRKDTTNWEPFCGEFTNFYYIEGCQRTMFVEKYDPQADTIHVIKVVTRDSFDPVTEQIELRRKRARWDSIKAASESPVTEPDNKEKE